MCGDGSWFGVELFEGGGESTEDGLIWSRTAIAVAFTSPQRASANPIAAALYCRRGNTSRGTTRNTAPHTTQR
jgi:hypothetical protein